MFKSSEYDIWRSKRIDEIRMQKLQQLRAQGQIKSLGYGREIADFVDIVNRIRPTLKTMMQQFVRFTPAPSTSMVDEAVLEIGGKQEKLNRLRIQADSRGLAEMLYGLFTGIRQNDGALGTVAESLYDFAAVSAASRLEQLREIDPDSDEVRELQLFLGDRKAVVDAFVQEFKSVIDDALTPGGDAAQGGSLLDRFALEYELYFYGSIGRAVNMQMYLPLSDSADSPLRGVTISYATARWNVNQEIQVKSINAPQGKLEFYRQDGSSPFPTPADWIGFFDRQSDFRQLLEKLHVGRVAFDFPVVNLPLSKEASAGSSGNRAFIENGVTMVPLRFVSEQLYTDVTWNGQNRQITIHDRGKGRTIVLTVGSTTATVNGQPVKLQVPPKISPSGKTYVPIRFVAEALGAEVSWDSTKMRVYVNKE